MCLSAHVGTDTDLDALLLECLSQSSPKRLRQIHDTAAIRLGLRLLMPVANLLVKAI